MTTLVVDASVATKWLIDEEGSEAASVSARRSTTCLPGSPVSRGRQRRAALLPAAWEIAVQHDRSVYDGVYLALAVALDAPLVTADRRLSRALRGCDLAEQVVDVKSLPQE